MRRNCVCVLIALSSLAALIATAEKASAQWYYGPTYYYSYYPPAGVTYYRSYSPTYYYQRSYYAAPAYSSYDAYYYPQCEYYPPPPCESSSTYQSAKRDAYQSSTAQATPSRPTTTVTVAVYDNRFEPATVNVQPGTTVRWVNRGQHTHTITSNDNRWDSGDIKSNGTYSATFKHPGSYYYYCRHHVQDKMQGVVIVGQETGAANGGATASGY
jgi:plastocyanin